MVNNGATHNIGLINAGEYCQANPDILLTRFTKEGRNGSNSGVDAFLKFNYTDNNTDAPTNLATFQNLGAVYGVAHLKKANTTYLATYFKRRSDL